MLKIIQFYNSQFSSKWQIIQFPKAQKKSVPENAIKFKYGVIKFLKSEARVKDKISQPYSIKE